MPSDAAALPAPTPKGAQLAHHFSTMERQNDAARLAMWFFLATEILLFAGVFTSYSFYRYLYPAAFAEGSHHMSVGLGTLNTFVLLASSFTVAMSIHFTRNGDRKLATACLAFSVLCGFGFLGIKAIEYTTHFHEGLLPGKFLTSTEVREPGVSMFFTIYYIATGLHGIHVIAGMTVLIVMAVRCWRGDFTPAWYTPLDLGGLYWHLVDIIWIYLYPLLYLI